MRAFTVISNRKRKNPKSDDELKQLLVYRGYTDGHYNNMRIRIGARARVY